ncbi:MAG: poly-gamma-glutamate system protein [Candidatus Aminicenantes bacterium]|nr:poly-gamma-glutamate system protein [Candidatus Aminicenantes bacterium]
MNRWLKNLSKVTIYGVAGLSLIFFLLTRYFSWSPENFKVMLAAAREMREAINLLRSCREEKDLNFDLEADPNQTGLIGLKRSSLTTSLGQLEAKRTTTNPDFAGLIVYLLQQAGVTENDAVAIGASSSFPALIVASLAAAKALKVEPLLIVSLGASQWGANDPHFTWLDLQDCLRKAGWLSSGPIAVSLGGGRDIGLGIEAEGREFLFRQIKERGLNLINEPDLDKNVALRVGLYETAAKGKRITAFINIGGGWANMGESEEILRLPPGLNIIDRSAVQFKGVVWEMARRNIPVIHLLYIKGLAEKYGLPWDPQPLPEIGQSQFYKMALTLSHKFKFFILIYFIIAFIMLLFYRLFRPFPQS